MKKALRLLALIIAVLFTLVSCQNNPESIQYVQVDSVSASIKGNLDLPESGKVSASDVWIKVSHDGETKNISKANADGSFVIPGLLEGREYDILFTTEKPATANERDISRGENSTTGYGGWLSNVTAAINEGNNVGAVTISPLGTIKGKVTLDGETEHYDILVYIPGTSFSAYTNADGDFYMYNVPEGTYNLRITYLKSGFGSILSEDVTVRGSKTNKEEHPIVQMDDIVLYRDLGVIEGKVLLDTDESPLGIMVMVKSEDGSFTYTSSTDEAGSYRINDVKPQTYTLYASKSGFDSAVVEDVVVVPAATKIVPIQTLSSGVRYVTGKVSMEAKTDHSGALITATNTKETNLIYSAISNTDGDYSLVNMKPGQYRVVITANNYNTVTSGVISVLTDSVVNLGTTQMTIIRGTIMGSAVLEGRGTNAGIKAELMKGTDVYATTTTDDSGLYAFSVPQGNYSGVRLSCEDFKSVVLTQDIALIASNTVAIVATEMEATHIPVVRGIFTLKDRTDSSGIEVYLEDLPEYRTQTDLEGKWELKHVPIGNHTLTTNRENVKAFSTEINLVPSAELDNGELMLIPEAATIQGFARLTGMTSFAGITVTATPTGEGVPQSTVTKADGSYYLPNLLSTSEYAVSFSKEGWKTEISMQNNFTELEVRTLDDVVLSDTTAPVIDSCVINNGGSTTADREIKIYLSATDKGSGNRKVQINTENRFDETVTYLNYQTELDYVLPEGNGDKNVYVKVYDLAGNGSVVYQKGITLTEQKTKVGGVLVGATDIVWTKEKSPYYVESSILVEEGRTLTIEAGVVVEFAGPYYIDVEGSMFVNGTEDDMVYMYGVGEGEDTWKGINFLSNNLVYTGTDYEPVYVSGNRMSYVNIQNNLEGITGNVWINNSIIEASTMPQPKGDWNWRGLAFGNAGFAEGPQSNETQRQSISYISGVFKDNNIIGDFSCYGRAPFVFTNNLVEGNVYLQKGATYENDNMEYFFFNNRFVGTDFKFGINVYYKENYFFVNNSFINFEKLSIYSSWWATGVDWGESSYIFDNCSFMGINQLYMGVGKPEYAAQIKGMFCDCLFDSVETIDLDVSVAVKNSNLIDVSRISVTSQRQYLGSNSLSNNYWGPDKTALMNSNGIDYNYPFISDYYDDITLTKVDYSGWMQNQFRTAGYCGDDYVEYSLTPLVSELPTMRIDSNYTITNTGVNLIKVSTVTGGTASRFRASQDINELLALDENEGWSAIINNSPGVYPENYNDWYIQIEDENKHQSNIYKVAVSPYAIGPSGGYVFFDKGDATDGWRYLEAAPADLRVVDGVPTVDSNESGYSNASTCYYFGYSRTSDYGSNLYVNGTTTYNAADCTGTAIGTGKTNTQLLMNAMGAESYSAGSGSSKTENYAARLCDILTYTVNEVTYDDWFLPSKDELNLMYVNLNKACLGGFANDGYYYDRYWSSSEYDNNSNYAWIQDFYSGDQYNYYSRDNSYRVRPVRAF